MPDKMEPTKKPKKVKLNIWKIPSEMYNFEYRCPTCHVVFLKHYSEDWKYVTRFKCSRCGQEIIVDKDN